MKPLVIVAFGSLAAALSLPAGGAEVEFARGVRPIFERHCLKCHGAEKQQGGLRFDRAAGALKAGDSGEQAIVPGKAGEGELLRRVASTDEGEWMPPEGERLSAEEIEIIKRWIAAGAKFPSDAPSTSGGRAEMVVTDEDRRHWSFRPLAPVAPPDVERTDWARTQIDRFILASLEAQPLAPNEPAGARTLVRRLYFDLIGLPPTPREVEEFCAAEQRDRAAAIAALVDRLLATRHYGERWGRHWLDVARYADSNGQENDQDRPGAYFYRDFVIQALNEDMPFDSFARWQIAGDELEPNDPRAAAATGFLVAGPSSGLPDTFLEEERLRDRYNELDDTLSTLGVGMLGLTIGCARCHDHKYDAIPTRDYYRLLAAFHGGDRAELPPAGSEGEGGEESKALVFRDFGSEPAESWLFERADFYDRDEPVELGFLTVLLREKTAGDYYQQARRDPAREDTTYQRKALAEWLTDLDHGAGALVARVIVNRVWQHHFGEGLVRTVNDFGVRGEPPTHPELLEWLAHDFVAGGWKLKRLHKLIVTSAVYQQSAAFDAEKLAADPDNRLLARMRPRRLEAEILRDTILAASGTLNLEPFGPAFKPPISKEAMIARNLKTPYPDDALDSPQTRRRTVYMFHKRVIPYPLLAAFDRPDSLQSCGRRESTTVAPQALALLNDEFVRRRAFDFADRLLLEAEGDDERLIGLAFEIALSRAPSDSERAASAEFLKLQAERRQVRRPKAGDDEIRRAALADFCQTLFSLNEFLYVD